MLYCKIAQALQEISLARRGGKAGLAAGLLGQFEPRMLCSGVRLLLGELWPPWEEREMGIGPETLAAALADVSDLDVFLERERTGEMGLVAEAALRRKGQHSLSSEPLQAQSVYERLRRISAIEGKESEQRKIALLRGLFLEAAPLEGKYIARTALRKMLAGMGHRTMIAALTIALHSSQEEIYRAYSLMPDLGSIAAMAKAGQLEKAAMHPKVPIRFMIFPRKEPKLPGAFLPKYPGLRVQVHKTKNAIRIFTSNLRDVTSSLNGLCRQLCHINADFVADADLIGFHDPGLSDAGDICSQAEMLSYINRQRLSRKSSISPALLAYDLISLQGEDICALPYQDRRIELLTILGPPQDMPFQGISPAREKTLMDRDDVAEFLCQKKGAGALLERDPQAAYRPGQAGLGDFIIRAEHSLAALI
jgi:DNA ligase-1